MRIVLDFSPIQGLSIADLRYDEVCLLPDDSRSYRESEPSHLLFKHGMDNVWLIYLTYRSKTAYHITIYIGFLDSVF